MGYDHVREVIEDRGLLRTHTGDNVSALCPSHDDRQASLSLGRGDDDRALLFCHAGCTTAEVIAALDLTFADLMTGRDADTAIAATYVYLDESNEPLYRVLRLSPKGFFQERWEEGEWKPGMRDVRRVLYHLPWLIRLDPEATIYVTEGEKDADNIIQRTDEFSTTLLGGAGKWRDEYAEFFTDRKVIIVADKDEAGIKHAEMLRVQLAAAARTVDVRVPAVGKDVSDHLLAGLTLAELQQPDDSIEWMSVDDEDMEIEWLLEPMLPRGAYVTIYGSAGAGKSYIALALAARLSERGCRTTFYSEENPTRVERRRVRRLCADTNYLRVASQQGVDLGNTDHVDGICRRDKGQDLILVDSYSVAYSSSNEDENARAVSFARVVHRITRETGATVVVIDHSGFDDSRLRGASAKGQQADVVIHMKERSGGWRGAGHPYEFSLVNEKPSRFENPFSVDGYLEDQDNDTIMLKWVGQVVEGWYAWETESGEMVERLDRPTTFKEMRTARSAATRDVSSTPSAPPVEVIAPDPTDAEETVDEADALANLLDTMGDSMTRKERGELRLNLAALESGT